MVSVGSQLCNDVVKYLCIYIIGGYKIKQSYNGMVSTAPYNSYVMMWPHVFLYLRVL